jgi:unsaturated chondroitin disaccharide hydrolase
MDFAQRQVRALVHNHPGYSPLYTSAGKWKHEGPKWTNWCDGFLPGMMWIFRKYEGARNRDAKFWLESAIKYTEPLGSLTDDPESHDLGFILFPTYYRWYRLTGDRRLHDILVRGGKRLGEHFQEKGQYLCSFVGENSLFINFMMNVGLMLYSARETGDKRLREVALRHALTTRRVLVRGDGSVAHEGLFDINTGEFQRQTTHQGYRGDSCWSRGLTWAMYGFALAYEYSRDPHFLDTAESCSDYYISRCPADGVPPWDFRAPVESREQIDTSAAAVAAAALLRICRIVPDPVKCHFYWTTSIRILRSLCENHLGVEPGWEGVLTGGVYHYHKGLGVDESCMWGDYYFVEALEQALRTF